ncbi:solute carrier family 25 (mitochondrial oxoglutarate transporter), member 11 [Angomonas deanei]|uniref:Mitochondrial carrier protein, putative n=1 Tax=Angomonas deanei TaxID=59799 RepID=S9UP75_9TRYP|nr:solute carrier family 25 (mitochondrial oxoglutarate transporter), member 11 [Angomonas deanei]EPY30723.1 solute carrier family 25 (mitochondrial oxoglutarate transporter), member 11 [Angomonas deanei]CAD2222330.1 Mitochondrial carrier protein, putative [Angomonas deanei]|eukprot:EPY29791.1 solute carrier family 25 (mitochondrial oxoglutarate transporter), member 11 [Angomonas deanei]
MSDAKQAQSIKDIKLAPWQTLLISGTSGCLAWPFAHPFEMWKNTQLMAPPGTSQMEGFRKTAKKGFFTGLSTGVMRQVVYATARLGCYPIFRDALLKLEHTAGLKDNHDPTKATILDRAIAGGSAGAFASCLSSPVEVCLVLQTTSKESLSILGAGRSVFASSGLGGFWRGIGPLASRAALVGVSQVAVHDQVLTSLRLRNSVLEQKWHDNIVINVASIITSFIYSFITMPVEVARVRMSAEAKLPAGSEKKYRNMIQCITRVAKEEGTFALFDSFLPYFCRCASHTVVCFFLIEYITRTTKERKLAKIQAAK